MMFSAPEPLQLCLTSVLSVCVWPEPGCRVVTWDEEKSNSNSPKLLLSSKGTKECWLPSQLLSASWLRSPAPPRALLPFPFLRLLNKVMIDKVSYFSFSFQMVKMYLLTKKKLTWCQSKVEWNCICFARNEKQKWSQRAKAGAKWDGWGISGFVLQDTLSEREGGGGM